MFESDGGQGMEVVDLNFESLRDLQEELGPFLSTNGFFLSGRSDFAASDVLRFRLMLPGDFVLIEGVGVAVWVRTPEEATAKLPFGVAVEFATLSDQGRELVERIVHSHVESGGIPFKMSRPINTIDDEEMQVDPVNGGDTAKPSNGLKFTVREDVAVEAPKEVQAPKEGDADEAEQRLPFEDAVESELEEIEEISEIDPGFEEPEPIPEPIPELIMDSMPVEPEDGSGQPEEDFAEPEGLEAQEKTDFSGPAAFEIEAADDSVFDAEPTPRETSGAFRVSLPDEPSSHGDYTPASWEAVDQERQESYSSPSKGRSGLLRIVAAIIILIAAAWVVWTQFPEYLPWSEGARQDAVVTDPVIADEEELPVDVIASLTEEDVEAAVEAAVEAVTGTGPDDGAPPEPTVVPPQVDPVSGPGARIVDIKTEQSDGTTNVLIRADGSIDSRRVVTSLLLNPARILVRISGIDSSFRPFDIPVGSDELEGIRIGHHPETRPPSLWIVLDRADEGVKIRETKTSGNVLRLEIGR